MLGLFIFLGIILVLILINKNTKSSPDGAGCIEQGCAMLAILFVMAFVVPDCAQRQQAERRLEPASGTPASVPRVMFTDFTISDAATPSVHSASYDASTSKIIVNSYVSGAVPGTPLTAKWFLLWSGTRQMLHQATVSATGPSHPVIFSAARPSNQLWPVGTYEVELWANDTLCQTLTFWVTSKPEREPVPPDPSTQEPKAANPPSDSNRRNWSREYEDMWDPKK